MTHAKPFLLAAALAALLAPALLAPAGLAPVAFAQDTAAPAPQGDAAVADDLSLGREEGAEANDGPGSTYAAATHGDWEQRCVRTEDGADPCQLYQLLTDAEGNAVAEFSVFGLPPGQQAVAGATAIVPLETLLTQELTLQVDNATAKKYPFSWCSQIGCIARIGFTAEDVAAMKRGARARITIVPVVAPDQRVTVEMSLRGFTAGYDAVSATTRN